jgi:hypothetical protein
MVAEKKFLATARNITDLSWFISDTKWNFRSSNSFKLSQSDFTLNSLSSHADILQHITKDSLSHSFMYKSQLFTSWHGSFSAYGKKKRLVRIKNFHPFAMRNSYIYHHEWHHSPINEPWHLKDFFVRIF